MRNIVCSLMPVCLLVVLMSGCKEGGKGVSPTSPSDPPPAEQPATYVIRSILFNMETTNFYSTQLKTFNPAVPKSGEITVSLDSMQPEGNTMTFWLYTDWAYSPECTSCTLVAGPLTLKKGETAKFGYIADIMLNYSLHYRPNEGHSDGVFTVYVTTKK